jgi:tyrosyl-tRNA synthetase
MSFTEFSYQLIQGYDFVHLYKTLGVRLQMGGSDQWGNITTGTELIRRMEGGEAFAMTAPLVKKADGSKFGKSEGGNVWLDPAKTSPYKFYQFWLNVSDEDAGRYIRIFTLLDQADIQKLEAEHAQAPHLRILQKALAADITERVHSAAELQQAIEASQILFGQGTTETLQRMQEETFLSVFEGIPQHTIDRSQLENSMDAVTLLSEATGVFPSRGEARKMIQGGGASINKAKITAENQLFTIADLLNGKYLLAQKGKKQYFLIIAS